MKSRFSCCFSPHYSNLLNERKIYRPDQFYELTAVRGERADLGSGAISLSSRASFVAEEMAKAFRLQLYRVKNTKVIA